MLCRFLSVCLISCDPGMTHSPVAGILISTLDAGCWKYICCNSQHFMSKSYFGNRPIFLIYVIAEMIFLTFLTAFLYGSDKNLKAFKKE